MRATALAIAPGIAIGLYLGRLLSELWAELSGSTPFWLAAGFTLATIVIGVLLTRKIPLAKTWPSIFLLLYVFYPEANWAIGCAVGTFALVIWLQDGSILANNHLTILASALLITLFFLLYLFTLAPDVLPADSGEFQIVATNLGIAHPPGFPLYTILAHLLTRLPIGPSPAYRVNLFSALSSTLTLGLIYLSVYMLTERHLASAISTIALGTATTFWAQSTTANIRSLTAFFAAAMFFALIGFYKSIKDGETEKDKKRADLYLTLFALALGFGITHHASLVFIGVIFAIFIVLVDPSFLRSPHRWWRPFLAFLLGFLPLFYLVVRASSGARGSAPELATWSGFLEHVLALGFRGDLLYFLEPAILWERVKIIGNVLSFQFEPLIILGVLIGLVLLVFRDWRLVFLLGGAFVIHTLITATYRAPQTVEYLMPAYIPLAILLGYAAGRNRGSSQRSESRWIQGILLVILSSLLVVSAWQFRRNYPSYQQLHRDQTARDYAQTILIDAPQDSVILADWHWATPLWYLQEVEEQRPDVTVRFVFPEGVSYGETWARRISEELADGRPVVSTHFDAAAYEELPTPEPIHEAFLFPTKPRLELPDGYTALNKQLGNKIQLMGYSIEQATVQIADEAIITLAWMPLTEDQNISLFTHMVGSDGQIVAQQDLPAKAQMNGLTLTQFRLTPQIGIAPGDYAVLTGASANAILPNEDGQERTLLSSLSVTAQNNPLATSNPTSREVALDSSLRLIGYDWDNTLPETPRLYLHWQSEDGFWTEAADDPIKSLPPYLGPWGVITRRWSHVITPRSGNYVPMGHGIIWRGEQLTDNQAVSPGQNITWSQYFLSSKPVMRDYTVSTRLIGFKEDGYHWDWWDLDDSIPAMGAIPTLKWIDNSRIRSPHFVTVDSSAPAGQQVGGSLNLYDAFTGRVLPILDGRISTNFDWIPLGSTTIDE